MLTELCILILFSGLKEGSLVKCSLVPDVTVLDSLSVTAQSQKDWEMLVSELLVIETECLNIVSVSIGSEQL